MDLLHRQIAIIDHLLQDTVFAATMAAKLEAAYYAGAGKAAPPFVAHGDESKTVEIQLSNEKIAINLAGFYALECGIGYLCKLHNRTPVAVISQIVTDSAAENDMLLLARFANATWKAGQPFRSLERIQRPAFISASALPATETIKDYQQVKSAAEKLLEQFYGHTTDNTEQQFRWLQHLLQDTTFAIDMAMHQEALYCRNMQQPVPPFMTEAEKVTTLHKPFTAHKIATCIAGFYALECAVNYFVTTRQQLPSEIIQAFLENTLADIDKELFARFANATWKAGQPFRGLDRITRDNFIPFCFLSTAEIEKDYVQLTAAAVASLEALNAAPGSW